MPRKKKIKEEIQISAQNIIDEVAIKDPSQLVEKEKISTVITKKEIEKMEVEEKKKLELIQKEEAEKVEAKKRDLKVQKLNKPKPIRNFFRRIFAIKLLDQDDKKVAKGLFFYVLLYGLLFNLATKVVFNYPFTYYSWAGWGLFLWFIENKFISFLRKLWIK